MVESKKWQNTDSLDLYGVKKWDQGYLSANAEGNLVVHPRPDKTGSIDITQLIEDARAEGLELPLLIRFSDILGDRLRLMHGYFRQARETQPVAHDAHLRAFAAIEQHHFPVTQQAHRRQPAPRRGNGSACS